VVGRTLRAAGHVPNFKPQARVMRTPEHVRIRSTGTPESTSGTYLWYALLSLPRRVEV
jgi:hypothetical protein